MSELIEWIERFERAKEELAEIIREANSSTKASKTALAEIQEVRDGIVSDITRNVEERTGALVDAYLDALGPELRSHMDHSVARVHHEFKKLEMAVFAGAANGDIRSQVMKILEDEPNKPRRGPSGKRVTGTARANGNNPQKTPKKKRPDIPRKKASTETS